MSAVSMVTVERKVLEKNDEIARQNRMMFAQRRLLALNLLSSPGSGKTSILERTLERLRSTLRIGVVEGDVQTDFDARRIAQYGVPVEQIVTNGGCHLDARLVREGLRRLSLDGLQLLFIENVGNLVCTANFDLGEAMKVVVLSVTEGIDKPLKYPAMFRKASVLIINKIDLLPHVYCDMEILRRNALQINPSLLIFETSCITKAGIGPWCDWLSRQVSYLL